jgi:hypothetical protein
LNTNCFEIISKGKENVHTSVPWKNPGSPFALSSGGDSRATETAPGALRDRDFYGRPQNIMITLIIGFVGLVILPALILAEVINRLIKEPSEFTDTAKDNSFTLSSHRRRSGKASDLVRK